MIIYVCKFLVAIIVLGNTIESTLPRPVLIKNRKFLWQYFFLQYPDVNNDFLFGWLIIKFVLLALALRDIHIAISS